MTLLFSGHETEFILDLSLSLLAGFLIGGERELRGKPAGISTQSFVIGGAMIFTFISNVLNPNSPTALAAQIITGVGFLGAGIIMKQEKGGKIRNLTTAASVWFSASIGMAIGFNLYLISILATLYSVFVPRIPHLKRVRKKKKSGS